MILGGIIRGHDSGWNHAGCNGLVALRRVHAVVIENKIMDHDISTCRLHAQSMHNQHHRQIMIEQCPWGHQQQQH